ncbi:MAG: RIP metalloprotease RseP [Pseudomonadota bacterium]
MSTTFFSFLIVLGILIFVHELGHFLVAKLSGIGVEKFSLGFGPKLVAKKVGMTEYRISAIPLGGYVKLVGESPDQEISDDLKNISFTSKSVGVRSLVVVAGPVFNLLLAFIVYFLLYLTIGVTMPVAEVGKIMEGSPAERAGLRPNDVITSINGANVESWDVMTRLVAESKGATLKLEISRANKIMDLAVTPEPTTAKNMFREDIKTYRIGIQWSGQLKSREIGIVGAFSESLGTIWEVTRLTFISIGKMIQGKISPKENLAGPIMIAHMAGEQARAGIPNLISFIGFLSIALGILNLLPIPILDGGQLAFFGIEAIMRKPVNPKLRENAQRVGFIMLGSLMIYVIYNDIARLVTKNVVE